MKKRILSLVMALCMVLLALPFAAMPVVAAPKEGFTTRLHGGADSDTWPTYESGVALKRFNGNWTMGYFDAGAYHQHYDFAKGNNIVTTNESPWTYTGVFLESGQMILTEGKGGGDANAFYELSTFKGNPVSESDVNKVAAVYAYTAPYTGTVELDMYSIFGVDRQLNNIEGVTKETHAYVAIFVNGKMVWPNEGDYYSQPSKWALLKNKAEFDELRGEEPITVDVTTRDVIQFAAALAPGGTSYYFMQPTVTYRDGYKVVPETVKQAFNPNEREWPAVGEVAGAWPLEQDSELWTMASFNKETGAITAYPKYTRDNKGVVYAHLNAATGESGNPWINHGGILLGHPEKSLIGAMAKGTDANDRAAYVKKTIANGEMTITLEGATIANATGGAMKNATANLKIYVNGALKATAPIETNASGALKNPVTATVNVARGDTVVLVADDFGNAAYIGGTPAVAYNNIGSFMNGTADGENDIAIEEVHVNVNGTIDLEINAFATSNVYENASDVILYIWDASVTGEKTEANATAVLPMEMNTNLFSFQATYSDFVIKKLADDLAVRVVAKDGDTVLCSADATVNAADVAYDEYLAAEKKVKTMYANLLNYAAYAQIYFNYNTENLANEQLPADLKALDYDMLYDAQFTVTKPSGNAGIADSEIGSFALILDNTLSIRAYINRWATEMDDTHKFYFQFGDTLAACYNSEAKDRPADENLSYIVADIGAHEMSKVFYFRCVVTYQMKVGDGFRDRQYFGYAMSYSVESYVSRMLESTEPGLEDLVRAMMEFGKSAAAVY